VSARDEVLARIRDAHAAAPPPELAYDDIARDYRTATDLDHHALVELLVDRLRDYRALVRQCAAHDLTGTIAAALAERGVRSLVVPSGLDQEWLQDLDAELRIDEDVPLTVAELDTADGVITGCALAIAQTGTLCLDGSAGQGRRLLSLIPDYHLCIVAGDSIVADVPQAIAGLDGTRPLTLISGPSATSDIELDRVEGVHGPRTLEVIIVEAESG
jgi:L-lactate dehydrogenase complex protein LldG